VAGAYAAVGAAAVAAISTMVKLTSDTIKSTDAILENAQKMGVSSAAYQKMSFLADQTGTSVAAVGVAIRAMSKATDTQKESFEEIGVAIRDANGRMKDQETLFRDTMLALSRMPESTERAAIAMRLLGKSAQELAPALNSGEEALRDYFETSKNAVTASDRLVEASDRYSDSMAIVGQKMKAIRNDAFEPLIVTLADFAEKLASDDFENTAFGAGVDFLKMELDSFATVLDHTLGKMGLLYRSVYEIETEIADLQNKVDKKGVSILKPFQQDKLRKLYLELEKTKEYYRKEAEADNERAEQKRKSEEAEAKRAAAAVAKANAEIAKKRKEEEDKKKDARSIAFHEEIRQAEKHYKAVYGLAMSYASAVQRDMPTIGVQYKSQTKLKTQKTDGGAWDAEQAKIALEEQITIRQAAIQSAVDTAQTLINIGNMVADAAVARDQKELDSWRTKEQEKIDALNISANRKRQLEKKLAEETIQREKDIAKRRGRIEIASTMANAASSIAQVYANMLASGAKFGVPGLLAAKIAAVTAAAGIMATATAQTAIIASQMNGYASGGMVGGRNARSTRGADDQVATVRTGEMVLNASQQKRLYDTIYNGTGGGGITVNIGELTGDKLQELEDMLLKLKSYGRI
jgi:hypothetical protein